MTPSIYLDTNTHIILHCTKKKLLLVRYNALTDLSHQVPFVRLQNATICKLQYRICFFQSSISQNKSSISLTQ